MADPTPNPPGTLPDLENLLTNTLPQILADAQGMAVAYQAALSKLAAAEAIVTQQAAQIAELEAQVTPPTPPPVLTVPAAPTHVVATAGVQSATVTWTAPIAITGAAPVTGYVGTLSGPGTVVVSGLSASASVLTAGTPYTISVVAQSVAGPSLPALSNTFTPTAPVVTPPPPPPSALIVPATPVAPAARPVNINGLIETLPLTAPVVMTFTKSTHDANYTAVASGATEWQAVNSKGVVVGGGPLVASATTVTVTSGGSWVGGGTVVPGHYIVTTNQGTSGIASGYLNINPKGVVYQPPATTAAQPGGAISAWMGAGPDRDGYNLKGADGGGNTAAQIVSDAMEDPWLVGPQDPARPRQLLVSPYDQANTPTQDPTPASWGQTATAMVAAGLKGAWYECPTNEPENGGWSMSQIISYWQACNTAILAADPTAKVAGWVSAGIEDNTAASGVTTFLGSCKAAGLSNHFENTHQNLSNIAGLKQVLGGIKAVAQGLPLWQTETGINEGQYGVYEPRRGMRQRTLYRLVMESYGWCKEKTYDFPIWDHRGSGLTTYLVEGDGQVTGNVRAGAYAVHVMSEALWGKPCTLASPPAALDFGTVGNEYLFGLHYVGTSPDWSGQVQDVVVLATDGMETGQAILNVNTTGSVVCWNGEGVPTTLSVVNGQVTVPLDDLLTYVFLPKGSTVTVAPDWYTTLTPQTLTWTAETGKTVILPGYTATNVHGTNVAGVANPYVDSTIPATLTATLTKAASGLVFKTVGPAWQTTGCSITGFHVVNNGATVYTYKCASAVTTAIPSAYDDNTSDACNATAFWTNPFAFMVNVPLAAGSLELVIDSTGFGGVPDQIAVTSAKSWSNGGISSAYGENDKQQLQLANLQILA